MSRVFAGRYEVIRSLGSGSLGTTYLCRHLELSGHPVVMKVFHSALAHDPVIAKQIRDEVVTAYGVSHPNVVQAYEYFRDGDVVAFTMEYVDGGNLAHRLAGEGVSALNQAMRLLNEICLGLQAIHDSGVVHRNLKPENILLTADDTAKISDFGMARAVSDLTSEEHVGEIGSIDYISPEYLERGQVDIRSDIYALGIIAYRLITGQFPFPQTSVMEALTAKLRSDPPTPDSIRRICPADLSSAIMRAIARDPNNRFQSADAFRECLELVDLTQALH